MAKEVRYCRDCGELITRGFYCDRCYAYYRKHPEGLYPLPPKGLVKYATNGDLICHICGQAHRKLIQHVYYKHNMSHNEYCDKFNLLHNTRLTRDDYQEKMRNYTTMYREKVVDNNLLKQGMKTRYKKGENGTLAGHHIKFYTIDELKKQFLDRVLEPGLYASKTSGQEDVIVTVTLNGFQLSVCQKNGWLRTEIYTYNNGLWTQEELFER